jgi:hypothetical protein
MAVAGDSRS